MHSKNFQNIPVKYVESNSNAIAKAVDAVRILRGDTYGFKALAIAYDKKLRIGGIAVADFGEILNAIESGDAQIVPNQINGGGFILNYGKLEVSSSLHPLSRAIPELLASCFSQVFYMLLWNFTDAESKECDVTVFANLHGDNAKYEYRHEIERQVKYFKSQWETADKTLNPVAIASFNPKPALHPEQNTPHVYTLNVSNGALSANTFEVIFAPIEFNPPDEASGASG